MFVQIKDWFIRVWAYLKEFFYTGERCNMCAKRLSLDLQDERVLCIRGSLTTFYICEECANGLARGIDDAD